MDLQRGNTLSPSVSREIKVRTSVFGETKHQTGVYFGSFLRYKVPSLRFQWRGYDLMPILQSAPLARSKRTHHHLRLRPYEPLIIFLEKSRIKQCNLSSKTKVSTPFLHVSMDLRFDVHDPYASALRGTRRTPRNAATVQGGQGEDWAVVVKV